MERIKDKKTSKRNSKRLDVDPLSGKPLIPTGEEEGRMSTEMRSSQPKQKRDSVRGLSQAAPRLSVIERNKMKINFKMALASKQQEEEKTGGTKQELEN